MVDWGKVSIHVGLWATVGSIVIAASAMVFTYFASVEYVKRSELARISEDISNYEGIRDYYQHKLDQGKELAPDEIRRFRNIGRNLDHLYRELEIIEGELRDGH